MTLTAGIQKVGQQNRNQESDNDTRAQIAKAHHNANRHDSLAGCAARAIFG